MSINHRYDFVYLFDVTDGNPNGDPDAGNLPRIDPETGQGLVTDVCLKRKVRNFVKLISSDKQNCKIFIEEKAILNQLIDEAHEQTKVDSDNKGKNTAAARDWMCQNYFDIRCFGAVMSTGKNAGQVRGPVQITFSRSIDRIFSQEHTITRMAVTKPEEAEAQSGDNRTMGRKATVPYGLYRCHGFISAHLADQTGFSEEDLDLFWQSLEYMFDHDRSAARGEMNSRGLYVFKHDEKLGNASAHNLFERISVESKQTPPRSFLDYRVNVNETDMPPGVALLKRIG